MGEVLAEALRETIRVQDGRLPLLDRHLARLAAGGCGPLTLERARAVAEEAAAAWRAPYGRMSLVVSVEGEPTAEISDRPSVIDVPGGPRIALVTAPEPRLPQGAAKPADRSQWDAAFENARGANVAVLVSAAGVLMDTSHATLWIRSGTRLLTPPSPPALAGVSRGVVFDVAAALGYEAVEALLTPADLDAADEVLLTTAVAGARAVRGRGGPAAAALGEAFERLFAAGR
ncbi:MAG: aminotransferase class IV [Coriobacteriia bacterium]|nr:aminotransferase class IV [Coriobacteriia bacterium]